jgi:hypothetical protein
MKTLIALIAVLAAAVSQPAPWPDEAYRVEWEETHIPEEVAPNVRIAMPVTLRNSGDRVWPASQVFIAYHWLRDGRLAVWDGERTGLPRDLRAGSRAAVSARLATPTEPGVYMLILTLVHEHVTWFEHRGAATVVRSITIRQPTQPDECGISGVTPCTAVP